MLRNKSIIALTLALALALLPGALSVAQAWPDLPPTKAYISGPGLTGEVAVADQALLTALRLGGLEDFSKGALPAQKLTSEPYKITRYFENGTFRMGDLTYYPGKNGSQSVVYFQDGAMKFGDQSPFNNQWYSTIASSDEMLQAYIWNASNPGSAQPAWLARNVGAAHETIGFDASAQTARFILPKGLRSADGKAYWTAYTSDDATVLHSFDVTTGLIRASLGLEGGWELGAISNTGKWLALKRAVSESDKTTWTKADVWKTTIAMVDAEAGKTTRTITLGGNFDIDALDSAGSKLYLIQHLPAIKPDHYQVRLYDLAAGGLQEGALVDKRDINEEMEGYAWDAIAAPNGTWLFTLYVGMREGHAFIHALNLEQGYAWCIDLPSGNGDEAMLEHYALALAPDGHTIYASNTILGVLAIADVEQIGEPTVVQFTPPADIVNKTDAPSRSTAVTSDGKQVFFSDSRTVWQYDTGTKRAKQVTRTTLPIIGMTLNLNGSGLSLAYADHTVGSVSLPVRAANAQNTSLTSAKTTHTCPVTKPAAQAFVPPAAYPAQAPYGEFWYGTDKLWTMLSPDASLASLPNDGMGFTQKVFWWRTGYDGTKEPIPALHVTGKQLDGDATFAAGRATNASHPDFGGWAMLTGVEIPKQGCWEITGEYDGEKLSFVVEVNP